MRRGVWLGILVSVLAMAGAARAEPEQGLALRITVADATGEDLQRARGQAALLVARYAKVPGLALLEGDPVANAKRQQEIELSASGMVDEDSRVVDRTMAADVTITLRGYRFDPATGAGTVTVGVQGPNGKREVPVTFVQNDELVLEIDEAVRGVVDARWAARIEGDCVSQGLRVGMLRQEACVAAIVRACAKASGDVRERLACLADRGYDVHDRAKQARKHPDEQIPMPPRLQKLMDEAKKGAKATEADMAQWQAYAERLKAFSDDVKQAMAVFRPRLVAAMEAEASRGTVAMGVGEGAPLTGMVLAGFRWNEMDQGPMMLFDVAATPGSRQVTRTVFGESRQVTEDVRSFGLRGMGDGGKVFDYRLLCAGTGPTNCNVQTALGADYFRRTRSVVWFEPDWRMRPQSP